MELLLTHINEQLSLCTPYQLELMDSTDKFMYPLINVRGSFEKDCHAAFTDEVSRAVVARDSSGQIVSYLVYTATKDYLILNLSCTKINS